MGEYMLTRIDYGVIFIYIIILAVLSYYASRIVKNAGDYFNGGKKVPEVNEFFEQFENL